MGKWDPLLPDSVLKELMLDKLLNRYLMITLCSQTLSSMSAASACKKVFISPRKCFIYASFELSNLSALFLSVSSSNAALLTLQIADCLPRSWFKDESVCLPQLQNFRNYVVQKVHSFCKQQPPQDPNTR